jgi:Domain of unknown function (DUF4352)
MGNDACTRSRKTAGVVGAAAGLTAAALLVASCSASPPHHSHSRGAAAASDTSTAGAHGPGTSAPATGTSSGQLGSTLSVSDTSGTQLGVTLKKLIDPASGANSYSKPASGTHFVGVQLRIQNKASSTYQNNANNETTITLSNGKTLHADYNPIAGCGNFDYGQVSLKSGAAGTGCVTFQVPKGEKVAQVGYGNTVFPGKIAEWQVS